MKKTFQTKDSQVRDPLIYPLPASLFNLIALGTSCMYDMMRG